jgi:hypothetical protein
MQAPLTSQYWLQFVSIRDKRFITACRSNHGACRPVSPMKLLARILRLSRAATSQSFAQSQLMLPDADSSGQASNAAARHSTRCELLRVVLRDTLNRQGIPASWLGTQTLVSTSRSGVQGIHWRLLVRHWDARLLTHSMALQQQLLKRVLTLDPLAASWLTGISWQFALPDESVCPGMPHPGAWTAAPPKAAPAARAAPAEPTMDVIAGPVRISDPGRSKQDAEADARVELERLLAVREPDYLRRRDGAVPDSHFIRTVPMRLE